jgi:hypothetical protein
MATVTNRKASQALPGQSVTVTLDNTDSAVLDEIIVGRQCTIAGGKIGYVDRVDLYGHSFSIAPDMPQNGFHTQNTPGYLAVSTEVFVVT